MIAICACVCLCLVFASACVQSKEITIEEPKEETRLLYDVHVSIDREEALRGEANILFSAPYEGCDRVCLWSQATITKANVDEEELHQEVGDVYTLLVLPRALGKGEQVTIGVCFEMPCKEADNMWQATDYIPLVCAYREGYQCPTPTAVGDYRAVAAGDVTLTISAPKSMVIALCGDDLNRTYLEDRQLLRVSYKAERHIAWVANPYYIRKSATVGDTVWEYYATTVDPLAWQSIQAVAANAHALWGDCKPKRVCLVQGCTVEIAGFSGLGSIRLQKIADEVVAQWGQVQGEAWIAAGISQYVKWAYLWAYDRDAATRMVDEARDSVTTYGLLHGQTGEAARMDRPLDTYDQESYRVLLQDKGLLFWTNLHEIAGDVVGECVHTLYSMDYIDTSTLLAVLKARTGKDYTYYVDAWVQGKAVYAR